MAVTRTRRIIDDAGADAVADAALVYARERGHRVAVVDPAGEIVALRRTAGAQVASSRVAVDKARTAAIFVRPSREIEEQVSSGRLGALALHGAAALTGGIPLRIDAEVVGAIGTSGETPDEDEAVSLAGAAAAFSSVAAPDLTFDGARLAAEAVRAAATERGVAPVAAVVDADGELLGSLPLLRREGGGVAMAAVATGTPTMRPPGPPELLPGKPEAVIDLQTDEGTALVGGAWRYSDCRIEEIDFVELGAADDPLGPGTVRNRTYDVVRSGEPRTLAPAETQLRLANGRVCFNWYEIDVTLPERVGELDPTGATLVFEIVVDDYAEIWVDGKLPLALGDAGGRVAGGFNVANRIVLTRDARPGQTFRLAVFGINSPISASPPNYIWVRSATLELHRPVAEDAPFELEGDVPVTGPLERVATGFEFTEGPVWTPDGALLFSSPNTNAIYRIRTL